MSNFLSGKRELANRSARRKTRKQLAEEIYRNPGSETCTRKRSKLFAKRIVAAALYKVKSDAKRERRAAKKAEKGGAL